MSFSCSYFLSLGSFFFCIRVRHVLWEPELLTAAFARGRASCMQPATISNCVNVSNQILVALQFGLRVACLCMRERESVRRLRQFPSRRLAIEIFFALQRFDRPGLVRKMFPSENNQPECFRCLILISSLRTQLFVGAPPARFYLTAIEF